MNVQILSPEVDEPRFSVETWWYDNSTLIVEYTTGETEQFPQGNIMEILE